MTYRFCNYEDVDSHTIAFNGYFLAVDFYPLYMWFKNFEWHKDTNLTFAGLRWFTFCFTRYDV